MYAPRGHAAHAHAYPWQETNLQAEPSNLVRIGGDAIRHHLHAEMAEKPVAVGMVLGMHCGPGGDPFSRGHVDSRGR